MFKKIILFMSFCTIMFAEGEKLSLNEGTVQTKSDFNLKFNNALSEPSFKRLGDQTKATGILSLATVAVLFILPEDFTGWSRADIKNIGSRYKKNQGERGLVWDPDNPFFNFVGHPYVGAVYYIAARKSGFDEFDSFMYSFLMSTFFWEMGIEGFAEAPSIQDIVITPGSGAILGEYLYGLEMKILANEGKIGNSRFLGKTALVFIDPIGTLANKMGYKDDEVQGSWTVMTVNKNQSQLAYTFGVKF